MKSLAFCLTLFALTASGHALARDTRISLPMDSAHHCLDLGSQTLLGTAQMTLPPGRYRVRAVDYTSTHCVPVPCGGEVCPALVVCSPPATITLVLRSASGKNGAQLTQITPKRTDTPWLIVPADAMLEAYFTDANCVDSRSSATLSLIAK